MSTILPWLIWDRQGDLLLNGHGIIPKTSKYLVRRCLNPQTSPGSFHADPHQVWLENFGSLGHGHGQFLRVLLCFSGKGRGACFCWPKGFRARILDARFGDLIWLWLFDLNSSKISWWWHDLLTQLLVVFFHLMIVFCLKWYLITAWMNTKKQIYWPNAFNWSKSSKSLWGVFFVEIQQWNAATQEGEVHQL